MSAGMVRSGREEVLAMYRGSTRLHDDGTPRTKHVTTNLVIDADGDVGRASARSCFTVLQAVPVELALQPVIAGRYHDDFVRVDGMWRFARREMFPDLIGDLHRHLLFELPGS